MILLVPGWISCTNNPIDSSQKRKFLVTEAVVQEKPNSSLARRTILYMKVNGHDNGHFLFVSFSTHYPVPTIWF